MRKIISIIIITIFFCCNCYGAEWETYESPAGYSIDYPSDWNASEDLFGLYAIVRAKKTLGYVSVGFIPLKYEGISVSFKDLEDFTEKLYMRDSKKDFNVKLWERGKTSINGREASFFVYTSTITGLKDDRKLKHKEYAFIENSVIYFFKYRTWEEDFDKYLPVAEKIVQSIKPNIKLEILEDRAFSILDMWIGSSFQKKEDYQKTDNFKNWIKGYMKSATEDIKKREPGIGGIIEAGQFFQVHGEHEKAIEHFEEAINIDPDDPSLASAYMYLGGSYYEVGQYDKAEENLLKAKSLLQEHLDKGTLPGFTKSYLEGYLSRLKHGEVSKEDSKIIDDIIAKLEDIKSYSVERKQVKEGKIISEAYLKYKKPGKRRSVQYSAETLEKTGEVIEITDGEVSWWIMEKPKAAMKNKSAFQRNIVHENILHDHWGSVCDYDPSDELKHIGEETIDGIDCYILMQTAYAGKKTSNKLYIQKDTGLVKKVINLDHKGNEDWQEFFSNYLLNIDIDDSEFEYTPPEDFIFVDYTAPMKSPEDIKKMSEKKKEFGERINKVLQ